jgi:hypothetical protein
MLNGETTTVPDGLIKKLALLGAIAAAGAVASCAQFAVSAARTTTAADDMNRERNNI